MDKAYLESLNRKLRDALGVAPSGDALYRWSHARDLTYRRQSLTGYVDSPQLDEPSMGEGSNMDAPANRWALASWQPPQHTLAEYRMLFGDSMAYPRNGRYVVTDVILHRGVEPTEALTDHVIGKEKARRQSISPDFIQQAREKRRAEARSRNEAILLDARPAFEHAPGKKDGVSFGGV